MTPLPPAAQPVVDILRRNVPRPKELPKPDGGLPPFLRWKGALGGRCPMGLLEGAVATPTCSNEFCHRAESAAVAVFAGWWDHLRAEDAAEAVELIWPSKEENHAS
jgi:hypothetical protein